MKQVVPSFIYNSSNFEKFYFLANIFYIYMIYLQVFDNSNKVSFRADFTPSWTTLSSPFNLFITVLNYQGNFQHIQQVKQNISGKRQK